MTEKSDMVEAARFASLFFRVLGALKSRHQIEFDEILIFFALGRLNFELGQGSVMMMGPTNIASLADFLGTPRETLRRKLLRLEEKGLAQRSSTGFVVKDIAACRRLSELAAATREAV